MATQRVDEKSVFNTARKIGDAEARESYLQLACADNPVVLQQIRDLLRVHQQEPSFLESPPPGVGVVATVAPPITEKPGTQIGPYKLREQIGEGGFGVVYVAEQQEPVSRKVALKIIKPGMDTRDIIARFEAERQALALMEHPNVAKVLDAGATESGRPYFVMELVRGLPITAFSDEQKLTNRERLLLFVDVCRAVQHAHQKGVIHRDLKPSNILVTMHDDRPVPKVIDFGVSKALSRKLTDKTIYTGYGQMVGTPLYMSPEQAQLSGLDVDTRSDVYSLGVLLYELLTGTTPFDKDTMKEAGLDELRRIIREDEPPRPSDRVSTLNAELLSTACDHRKVDRRGLGNSLRGELDWIVMKALEKERNRRYESASSLAADVERHLNDEPVQARPPSLGYRFGKFARRNRAALTWGVVVSLAALMVVGSIGWNIRDQAERQARLAGQVGFVLKDVERLMQEQKWREALAVAKRAESIIAGGDADGQTRRRVRQLMDNLEFVERLDEVRLMQSEVIGNKFNWPATDRRYSAAFREHGVDIENLPVARGAELLSSRTGIVLPLAIALDDWAFCKKQIRGQTEESSWKKLLEVAKRIDPDPLRNRLRATWHTQLTTNSKRQLALLSAPAEFRGQSPTTLVLLGETLLAAGLRKEAVLVLRSAQQDHPGSFWINYNLAFALGRKEPRHPDVLRFYSAALAVRPDSAAVYNSLGKVFARQRKLDEAVTWLRKAVEFEPTFAVAYMNLGDTLRIQKKFEEAITCHRKAIELDPTNAAAYTDLGNVLYDQKKLDEAVSCYNKAIELDPTSAAAYTNLGLVLQEEKKFEEAVGYHRKAIELDPTYAVSHHNLGSTLGDQKKLDEAVTCYKKAIELDPTLAAAYTNLGNVLREQEEFEEAIGYHRKAIELDPTYANAHNNLGLALAARGELRDAVACYRKAIELDAKRAPFHINLGIALRSQGELDEAATSLRRAIELDPELAEAHSNLGLVQHDQRKPGEAVSCYRKAIELKPDLADAHDHLGLALAEQQEFDAAVACHQKAIELEPEVSQYRNNLGLTLQKQNRLDEAVVAFRTAIPLDPERVELYVNLGYALCQKGEPDQAITILEKAIQLDPQSAAAHHNLGLAQEGSGRVDAAVISYRKALEIDPNSFSHFALGRIAFRRGKPAQAMVEYQEAIRLGLPTNVAAAAWQGLGWAQYQTGDWKASLASLEKSCQLEQGGDCGQWIVMALVHWKLAADTSLTTPERAQHRAKARAMYERSVEEMDAWDGDHLDEVQRAIVGFRQEAETLLGIPARGSKRREQLKNGSP